jgi:hypothetical protein
MKRLKPNSWCAIPWCPCGGKPKQKRRRKMILISKKIELPSELAHAYLVEHDLIKAQLEDGFGIDLEVYFDIDLDDGFIEINEISAYAFTPKLTEFETDSDAFEKFVQGYIDDHHSELLEHAHEAAVDAAEARYESMIDDR